MVRSDYYGRKFGTTSLELFWEDPDGRRLRHRVLLDQEAYDTWHMAGYLKELLVSRRAVAAAPASLEAIPRLDKHLLLYLILAVEPGFASVLELGSSLMEVIDGLEAVHAWVEKSEGQFTARAPRTVTYGGVEISPLCTETSLALHPGYDITIYPDATRVDRDFNVMYDRIVSGSAFETAQELAAFVNRTEVALMNLFVSKHDTFVVPMVGRAFTYFSLAELVAALNRPLFHLFGDRAPRAPGEFAAETPAPVVEGFFLAAREPFVRLLMERAERVPAVKAFFESKRIVPRDARTLLD